jgi:exodeoxyribonuclease-5
MQWSPQQDAALLNFKRWYADRDGEQVFYLFGYAGTGKTSIALELTQGIDGPVIFAAFTGKAASVMRRRGCGNAQTLHSLLYNVKNASKKRILELEDERARVLETAGEGAAGAARAELERINAAILEAKRLAKKPSWELNPFSPARDAALIVVDEVSMVDGKLGEDLLSFGKPVLVLGDPAQLPPVKGLGFFNVHNPNVMLTEVHRHALDNPILALATKVRQGEALTLGNYGDSAIVPKSSLRGGEALDYDQVLVGRNVTRQFANRTMRNRLGYEGTYPVPGEKLVCLRNDREKGFLNGTIWTVETSCGDDDGIELKLTSDDGGDPVETLAYSEPFRYLEAPSWGAGGLSEFTYGYALTTHKAQGSEWPSVYIVDESAIARRDADRWLYTAITRASDKLLLIR